MKSRFRLARVIWAAFFTVFMICVVEIAVLVQLNSQIEEVADQNMVSRMMARQASRLLAISHSVTNSPSPTNTEQWRLSLQDIKSQVGLLDNFVDDTDLMTALTQKADGLDDLFVGLINLSRIEDESLQARREAVLSARLISEVQQITEMAYVLNEESYLAREALSKKRRSLQLVASLTYAFFLLMLMYLIQRRMLRPLRQVADVAEEMKAGNFTARCKLPPGDELGDIAVVMNELAEKLGSRIQQFNETNAALEAEVFRKVQSEARLEDALSKLHSISTILKTAGRMTGVGGWSVEVATNKLTWSEQTYAIVEAEPDFQPTLDDAVAFYDGEQARQGIRDALEQATKTGKTIEMELPFITMKGRRIWVQVYGEVQYVERGGQKVPEYIFGAFQEITERRNAEMELRRAMEEAQSASTAKGDFLASMSHEVRTPLNAIVGLAYMLRQTPLNGEQRSLLTKLEGASNSLIELVSDILDLSKIETGNMELENREFSMLELLDTLAGIAAGSQMPSCVDFVIAPHPGLPEYCVGDGVKLKQVLVNLLGNAVKFTARGRIELDVNVLERVGERVTIQFRLKDTGIGMSQQTMGRLFQVFSQGDSSISRRFGGTGIGLALSQKIVQKMGGEIQVQSELDVGSEFFFQVELLASAKHTVVSPKGFMPNLLFVEDDPHQFRAMDMLSQRHGWVAHQADSVACASEIVETLRREAPAKPLLVLTCPALKTDALQDALSGVQVVRLIKPVTPTSLFNIVMDSLRSGTQPEQQTRAQLAQSAPQSSNALAGVRLLAVDDNALNLSILKGILTKHGAEVVLANNGQEAVDIVAREHERLDLCLMDVQMPVMNGLDACTYIHDELKLPGFPVIALTAGAMLSEHRKAIEAGMSGVLTKPLEVQKVIETVNLFRRQGTS